MQRTAYPPACMRVLLCMRSKWKTKLTELTVAAAVGCGMGGWWPGTGSNRRRRPFQGRALPLSYLAAG